MFYHILHFHKDLRHLKNWPFWLVPPLLHGASYECHHTRTGRVDKFHAKDLSPSQTNLCHTLHSAVDGPGHHFGQIYRPLSNKAYEIAGIE